MVKTEVLDPELAKSGWHRFNFPWCTGYSPKRYQIGLDNIFHKDPNDCRLQRRWPILLFDIEANMHNKHLGRIAMSQSEIIDVIDREHYRIRKAKAVDIQALNTRLFCNLIWQKNPSENNFLWPSFELWPCGTQYCSPFTSKVWCSQGDHTLHLHDAPKHVSLSKNGIWELQIHLRSRHLVSNT